MEHLDVIYLTAHTAGFWMKLNIRANQFKEVKKANPNNTCFRSSDVNFDRFVKVPIMFTAPPPQKLLYFDVNKNAFKTFPIPEMQLNNGNFA